MWSRWDMQDTPPDILITNYSMLNIMLMRQLEDPIFEKTRAWLEGDSGEERVFFLVVDELHSYRGTPGTEVAYVLRLLLERLGLTPDSRNLRILATTASLDESDDNRVFLREFFGRDNFDFINAKPVVDTGESIGNVADLASPLARFAENLAPDATNLARGHEPSRDLVGSAFATLSAEIGEKFPDLLGQPSYFALRDLNLGDAIRRACIAVNGSIRATRIGDIAEYLFPSLEHGIALESMRGLLLALGYAHLPPVVEDRVPPLQPLRGHLFLHNLQAIWVCINPSCSMKGTSADELSYPCGRLTVTHQLMCHCGSRILHLIVCEVCGDVFFGGFRGSVVLDGRSKAVLAVDQPNLENIPEHSIADERYSGYAVFWPLSGFDMSREPLDMEWTQRGQHHRWVRARIQTSTGLLMEGGTPVAEDEVSGWLYRVKNPDANTAAIPGKCPSCNTSYIARGFSPLRNHRTGFQKSSQVISGTLLREIAWQTNYAQGSSDPPKLVIFSDSRQDAAKLAAGIELDHYRDMVRLAVAKVLSSYWDDEIAFVRRSLTIAPATLGSLEAVNAEVSRRIQDLSGLEHGDANRFLAHRPRLAASILGWMLASNAGGIAMEADLIGHFRDFGRKVALSDVLEPLLLSIAETGMCPGGPTDEALTYKVGQGASLRDEDWFHCFDFSKSPVVERADLSPQQSAHLGRLRAKLAGEMMRILFPHRARTFEGLGQGWVTASARIELESQTQQLCDGVIRQLGIRGRHTFSRLSFAPGIDEKLPRNAKRYIKAAGGDEAKVLSALLESGAAKPGDGSVGLDPAGLAIMLPPNSIGQPAFGFRCSRCNAFYLHESSGTCPDCAEVRHVFKESPLPPDFDYYTYLSSDSGQMFRMHAEELTGQTDSADRQKRQRWFQDAFLRGEVPRVQGVDVLSVTTTMEAGVDIGALFAIVLANMPPRRFNYQQRVGRAGRRSGAVALSVTFCRGRSHDDFYFQRPESITGDPPPSPYVDMRSVPILERVAIKEVMRLAFSQLGLEPVTSRESVHGEFGRTVDWALYRERIARWLSTAPARRVIDNVLSTLCVSSRISHHEREAIATSLATVLIDRVDAIVADPSYNQENLSERLANAGLLPMFGFPTRVRVLYTRFPQGSPWPPKYGVIDRDIDIALSQFAPGSQVVKDKAVHTACGLVNFAPSRRDADVRPGMVPSLRDPNPAPIGLCTNCQALVTLPYSVEPQPATTPVNIVTCPVCGRETMRELDAREPQGFFSNLEPQEFEGRFEWTPRAGRPTLAVGSNGSEKSVVGNILVSSFTDDILTINENGDEGGFAFRTATFFGKPRVGAYAVEGFTGNNVGVSGDAVRAALLSRRRTDVLLADIVNWPFGVQADPTTVVGRAAWYSFAFFLRIAAGAHLDVDPLELDASFRTTTGPAGPKGQVFLSDRLENGAGYSRFLSLPQQFDCLLQAGTNSGGVVRRKWAAVQHASRCDTSCNLCLRDYASAMFHSLLDWRLALDMAMIAGDSSSDVSLFRTKGALDIWDDLVSSEGRAQSLLRQLGYMAPEKFGKLRGFRHSLPDWNILLLERHPLWTSEHPSWLEAYELATQRHPGIDIKPVDPFLLVRRPGDFLG
jgi:hypothetical protein